MQYQPETIQELNTLKTSAEKIAEHFWHQTATMRDAADIRDCATNLRIYQSESNGTFADTWYCNHRHCPICQRQKALKWCSKLHQVMNDVPDLLEGRWIYLTLTTRNCHVSDLRKTLERMIRGFYRLKRQNFWKRNVIGGIRFIEVNQGREDKQTAHPHFHCLLLVRPSMFSGNNYMSGERWSSAWQHCLGVPFPLRAHVHRLNNSGEELRREIARHVYYSMKPELHVSDRPWFLTMVNEVKGLRFVEPFGELRGYLSALDKSGSGRLRERNRIRKTTSPSIQRWDQSKRTYQHT